MFADEIFISPKYRLRDYKALSLSVDSDTTTWEIAIDIFKDRMESRFILIIQDMLGKLERNFRQIDYSFSIMALNCLLIETLRQFKTGHDKTIGPNKEAFVRFFAESRFFNEELTAYKSKKFYEDVRCGLLHQAQTKSNTQLTIEQYEMIKIIENGCIRVNVVKFTQALFEDYEDYLYNIQNEYNEDLRKNFVKKMNHIINTMNT